MTSPDQARPVRVDARPIDEARFALISRPVGAACTVLMLAATTYAIPELQRWRLFAAPAPNAHVVPEATVTPALTGETELPGESTNLEALAQPEHVELPLARSGPIAAAEDTLPLPRVDAKDPPVPLIRPEALSAFYRSLGNTALRHRGAITRVFYFGDSLVASDYVTGTLRRKLQDEFGDAGHGFVLLANAWPAYFHNDVFRFASRGWKVSRIVGPYAADGLYGLGGVSFAGPPGVRARVATATKGTRGRAVSRFRIAYLEQPHGGTMEINVDGKLRDRVDTAGGTKRSAFLDVETTDGEHMLELVARRGSVRAFGVALERDTPGVVLDAIGIQGARIRFLDKNDDEHWVEQLSWRKPNLLVYQFGANESGDGFAYSMEDYFRTMKDVLEQGQRAVPDASCLIVAAMDRARKEGDVMVTVPVIPLIVEQQEKVAADVGCAFFNTYEAMGGRGSMARWVRRGLGQADLTHPTGVGAEILGNWVYRALIQGYSLYRSRVASGDDSPPAP